MSLTTIEPNKQLYTLLYQYNINEVRNAPSYVFYFGTSILTTDHDAVIEHANMLVKLNPRTIYTVSTVTPTVPAGWTQVNYEIYTDTPDTPDTPASL